MSSQAVENLVAQTETLSIAPEDIVYEPYKDETQLADMTRLISLDLSEPYSIYTYRYFLNCFKDLAFLAFDKSKKSTLETNGSGDTSHANPGKIIGVIICKIDTVNQTQFADNTNFKSIEEQLENTAVKKGYIGMLAIDHNYRRLGIASKLVELSIDQMVKNYKCKEVMLETEITNRAALNLYDRIGFLREERLYRYYLNGQDALRLTLYLD